MKVFYLLLLLLLLNGSDGDDLLRLAIITHTKKSKEEHVKGYQTFFFSKKNIFGLI